MLLSFIATLGGHLRIFMTLTVDGEKRRKV